MVRALVAGLSGPGFHPGCGYRVVSLFYFILFYFNFYFIHKICPEVGAGDTIG